MECGKGERSSGEEYSLGVTVSRMHMEGVILRGWPRAVPNSVTATQTPRHHLLLKKLLGKSHWLILLIVGLFFFGKPIDIALEVIPT